MRMSGWLVFDRCLKAYIRPFRLDRKRIESAQPFCLDRARMEANIHYTDLIEYIIMHVKTHVYNYNKAQLPLARPGVINAYGHLILIVFA